MLSSLLSRMSDSKHCLRIALPATVIHPLMAPSPRTGPTPTTHLSLHDPFDLMPPSALTTKIKKSSSSSGSSSAPSLPPSKGQLHVKLIQARGLAVRSPRARPYVVVQFEQAEFVSRDPTDETDKEVRGAPTTISRNVSFDRRSGSHPPPPDAPPAAAPTAPQGLFGRLSAHNPTWKHQVSLYVPRPARATPPSDPPQRRHLRGLGHHPQRLRPRSRGPGLPRHPRDQAHPRPRHLHRPVVQVSQFSLSRPNLWCPDKSPPHRLKPFDDEVVTGEIRVQITYEQFQASRRIFLPSVY